MKMGSRARLFAAALAASSLISVSTGLSIAGDHTTVAALVGRTHFHGIAVDASDSSRIYLATHHGLYAVAQDGKATLVSPTRNDFMGFTAHPSDPLVLYASGHPEGGGNLGFIMSTDGGRSWQKLSDGSGGPVDFHQMDVSKADANVIYGVYGNLQRSTNGGWTWTGIGPAPAGLIGMAASARHRDTLYAATETGLLQSLDAGRSWKAVHPGRRAATMVYVSRAGDVYAFIIGTGLVRSSEDSLEWHVVGSGLGSDFVLHLAVDPKDRQRLYAVAINQQTRKQALIASRDGGATWSKLGPE